MKKREANNNSATAIEALFAESQSRLGANRQHLLRTILDHCDETCFLSSHELAERFDVDPATIVRAVQALGYEGFGDFAIDLRQHFMQRMTPYTALRQATRSKEGLEARIDDSLDKAIENITVLKNKIDLKQIIALAAQIHRSRHILVIGVDLAYTLSHHLAYCLTASGFHAEAPLTSEGSVQHKVRLLGRRDLLIGISFGRGLRVTVEALKQARLQGVPTFGITDSVTTPIARYSDSHFVALTASPSVFGSYEAPIALIHAIYVACVHFDPKRSLHGLKPTDKDYSSGSRWYRESKTR